MTTKEIKIEINKSEKSLSQEDIKILNFLKKLIQEDKELLAKLAK